MSYWAADTIARLMTGGILKAATRLSHRAARPIAITIRTFILTKEIRAMRTARDNKSLREMGNGGERKWSMVRVWTRG